MFVRLPHPEHFGTAPICKHNMNLNTDGNGLRLCHTECSALGILALSNAVKQVNHMSCAWRWGQCCAESPPLAASPPVAPWAKSALDLQALVRPRHDETVLRSNRGPSHEVCSNICWEYAFSTGCIGPQTWIRRTALTRHHGPCRRTVEFSSKRNSARCDNSRTNPLRNDSTRVCSRSMTAHEFGHQRSLQIGSSSCVGEAVFGQVEQCVLCESRRCVIAEICLTNLATRCRK